MIHSVLRPQYPNINHQRVYRIYTAEGLRIRKLNKIKRVDVRVPLVAALAVNHLGVWTSSAMPTAGPAPFPGASSA